MHNLVGIPTETAKLQVRAELAEATISAYSVTTTREHEVKADAVGVLVCPGGDATFTRAWYYWMVDLSRPLPYEAAERLNQKWSEVVRVDGFAGGTKPDRSGVRAYHVDTQAGLNALVAALIEEWGQPETQLAEGYRPSNSEFKFVNSVKRSLGWIEPTFMPAPATQSDLAKLQISALSLLGGIHKDPCHHLILALRIALDAFGDDSSEARSLHNNLADTLRTHISHLRRVCEQMRNDSDRYVWIWQLEAALTERVEVLRALGRGEEARAESLHCEEARTQLVKFMQAEIANNAMLVHEAEMGLMFEHSDLYPHIRFERATTTWSLGLLQMRRNEPVEAQRLFAEAHRLANVLDKKQAARFAEFVKTAK